MPVTRRMTKGAVLENSAMSGAGESWHSISRKNRKGKEDVALKGGPEAGHEEETNFAWWKVSCCTNLAKDNYDSAKRRELSWTSLPYQFKEKGRKRLVVLHTISGQVLVEYRETCQIAKEESEEIEKTWENASPLHRRVRVSEGPCGMVESYRYEGQQQKKEQNGGFKWSS